MGISVAQAESLFVFGRGSNGEMKSYSISEHVFRYSFGKGLESMHRKALTHIAKFKQTAKEFNMSRVIVGLKIETEFGVGNVLELGTESAFDLRFEPLPKPVKPVGGRL
jgi:hypothetical protein